MFPFNFQDRFVFKLLKCCKKNLEYPTNWIGTTSCVISWWDILMLSWTIGWKTSQRLIFPKMKIHDLTPTRKVETNSWRALHSIQWASITIHALLRQMNAMILMHEQWLPNNGNSWSVTWVTCLQCKNLVDKVAPKLKNCAQNAT